MRDAAYAVVAAAHLTVDAAYAVVATTHLMVDAAYAAVAAASAANNVLGTVVTSHGSIVNAALAGVAARSFYLTMVCVIG